MKTLKEFLGEDIWRDDKKREPMCPEDLEDINRKLNQVMKVSESTLFRMLHNWTKHFKKIDSVKFPDLTILTKKIKELDINDRLEEDFNFREYENTIHVHIKKTGSNQYRVFALVD